jgi:hypothetical protein
LALFPARALSVARKKPVAAPAGRVFQPHFLIVPLGTTVSVMLATNGLGKLPAAPHA